MNSQPELPELPKGRKSEPEEDLNIIWAESDDVYKPIPKSIRDFMMERAIGVKSDAHVYINADALTALKAHLKSNLRIEQGGILFGNAYQDSEQGIYVDITAAIAAPATVGTGAHLDFTPSSWTGIMDYAKAQHPDDNIVGWYHSHPNLSAFMSGTDMNTQRAFFYHPWCLSIVYDPCREDMKFFLGRDAQAIIPKPYGTSLEEEQMLEEEPAYYSDNTSGKNPIIEWQDSPRSHRRTSNNRDTIKSLIWLGICLVLILSFYRIFLDLLNQGNISSRPRILAQPNESIAEVKQSTTLLNKPLFNFSLKEMPSDSFRKLMEVSKFMESDINHREYLNFSITQGGEKIGKGNTITFLEAAPSAFQDQSIHSVKLKYQIVDLSDISITVVDDSLLFNNSSLYSLLGSSSLQQLNNNTPNESIAEFKKPRFIFPIYSYDNNQNAEKQKEVSTIIYIPKSIEYYLDNERHSEEIGSQDIR